MDDEKRLDELLAKDAAGLREETDRALRSGLQSRIMAGLRMNAYTADGARAGWGVRLVFAAVLAAMVLVFAVVKITEQSPIAPPPRVAVTLPPPLPSARVGTGMEKAEPVRVHRHGVVSKPRPFPSPVPLTRQEQELMLLARNEPQELSRLYQDQESMRADFERGNKEFAEKVAAQNKGEQDDR